MKEILKADGTWHEGKASPELLDKELRQLPADHVTKDPADPDRIHPLDAPHTREALEYDLDKRDQGEDKETKKKERLKKLGLRSLVKPGRVVPFTTPGIDAQWEVDLIRFRILSAIITTAYEHPDEPAITKNLTKVQHLWFPKNNLNSYGLRKGHAPPNINRPAYLKNIELFIDITNWPDRVIDVLKKLEV